MATCDHIKLELPMDVKRFQFTFECRTPGPISRTGTVKAPDASGIHTEVPGALSSWLGAVEAGPPVVDDSVTEPESELVPEHLKRTPQALVSTAPPVDDSVTEPESVPETRDEPATPVEFYRWYHANKKDDPLSNGQLSKSLEDSRGCDKRVAVDRMSKAEVTQTSRSLLIAVKVMILVPHR
ncbi:hypothetical protein EDD22DRAFT_1031005 [Suillus occidentalis]|nr:hypothetical protein EDD22DRAFT_1031005 [Suillus occidentalis]